MVGQVVAVASGKGGVGKTTTVVNLGVVLRRADHSVALVDADLGMANLGPMLGVNSDRTLHDVLAGEATLEEALVEEAPGFAVLRGSESLSDYPGADPRNLGGVLEALAEEYDFVLVDTGAGMSHEDVLPLGLADRVLLVTSPDRAAVGDTRKTAELAGLARGDVAGLVVTKAEADTDAAAVAESVGVELLGTIPYDGTVRKSTASGRPLEAVDPDTPAAEAYRDLAAVLADGNADPLRGAPAAAEMGADEPAAEEGSNEPAEAPDPAPEPVEAEEPSAPADVQADESDADAEPPEAEQVPAGDDGDEAVEAGDGEDEPEAEDPLAEFEDDEPERSEGFFSRLGRLFR